MVELPYKRLVICREDLPSNPRWREEGYPDDNCWDIYELFLEASKSGIGSSLWHEARRIWWEQYWRSVGRYRKGRPFFDVYECDERTKTCKRLELTEKLKRRVLMEINIAGFETGVTPRGAKIFPWRPYKERRLTAVSRY